MMTPNENNVDRGLRIVLGLILVSGGIELLIPWSGTAMNLWGVVLGVVGLVPLLTGIIGWCPMYNLCKFSTLESKETDTSSCERKEPPKTTTRKAA